MRSNSAAGSRRLNGSGKKRIGLVTTELGVGGAEKCVANLAIGLQRRNHEVAVFSLRPAPPTERNRLVIALEAAGITPQFLNATAQTDFLRVGRTLAREIADRELDAVQSFLYHANVVTAWACKGLGIPRFASLRVTHESYLRKLVHRPALKNAKRIICVSNEVAQFATRQLHVSPLKIDVIANGVEIPLEAPPIDLTSFGIHDDRPLALAAGRLTRQKGFDWLLNEASQFLHSQPDACLVIVGSGEEKANLEAQIARHPCGERIRLIPWQADFAPLLARADVFLLPSRWEGMANAMMEAMAAGKPIVCNKIEGVSELLGDDLGSEQIAIDAHDFSNKTAGLLRDPSQLGPANRTRVQQKFSVDQMIDKWQSVLLG